MHKRNACLLSLLPIVLLALAAPVAAQDEMPAMTPEQQAEMMAWMQLAQPGPHHEHLARYVGNWRGDVHMWMGPDAPELTEVSSVEVAWVLGGRFLEWQHNGQFGGMPYEARALEGYNNGDRRYESTWADNFGTLIMFFEGSCSDDGRKREMSSSFEDVVAGGTVTYRTVYEVVDKDHFTYTAYMDKGDGEFKNMFIAYERK